MSSAEASPFVPPPAAPAPPLALRPAVLDEERGRAAHRALRAALAGVFRALGTAACSRYLGPIVPGATMPGGARVPGTSFELDPAQAAFNLALLLHWRQSAAAAGDAGIPALLAVADWRARRALMEGREPIRVRALLEYLLLAHDLELALPAGLEPGQRLQRVSGAAVTALLGGSEFEIASVLAGGGGGAAEGPSRCGVSASGADRRLATALALADATGRAVHQALFALKHDSRPRNDPSTVQPPTPRTDAGAAAPAPPDADDFAASLEGCFPPKQVKAILARFADPVRLEACPVNALVALLVTN